MTLKLGQVVSTAGVSDWMTSSVENTQFVIGSIARHSSGDWGEVCDNDKESNNLALKEGTRILSSYSKGKDKIWIITEWDRSVTTVLFPNEY